MKTFGGEIELVVEGDKTRRICARSLIGRNPSFFFFFSFRESIRVVDPRVCFAVQERGGGRGGERGGREKRKVKDVPGKVKVEVKKS